VPEFHDDCFRGESGMKMMAMEEHRAGEKERPSSQNQVSPPKWKGGVRG